MHHAIQYLCVGVLVFVLKSENAYLHLSKCSCVLIQIGTVVAHVDSVQQST